MFAGLTLQVLIRALVDRAARAAVFKGVLAADEKQHSTVRLCVEHPYAVRLRVTVDMLLQAQLLTPPAQALRRLCVANAPTS